MFNVFFIIFYYRSHFGSSPGSLITMKRFNDLDELDFHSNKRPCCYVSLPDVTPFPPLGQFLPDSMFSYLDALDQGENKRHHEENKQGDGDFNDQDIHRNKRQCCVENPTDLPLFPSHRMIVQGENKRHRDEDTCYKDFPIDSDDQKSTLQIVMSSYSHDQVKLWMISVLCFINYLLLFKMEYETRVMVMVKLMTIYNCSYEIHDDESSSLVETYRTYIDNRVPPIFFTLVVNAIKRGSHVFRSIDREILFMKPDEFKSWYCINIIGSTSSFLDVMKSTSELIKDIEDDDVRCQMTADAIVDEAKLRDMLMVESRYNSSMSYSKDAEGKFFNSSMVRQYRRMFCVNE